MNIETQHEFFQTGQRVLCYNGDGGLYREVVIVNEKHCFSIPDGIEDEVAVSLPANYLTAYFSLFEIGNLRDGQNVLIHSCAGLHNYSRFIFIVFRQKYKITVQSLGGVGWAVTQLARTVENVTIVGTASPQKFSEAEKNGVNYILPSDRYFEELQTHPKLNNMKFDIIIDPIGGSNISISQSLLDHLGKLILIGEH